MRDKASGSKTRSAGSPAADGTVYRPQSDGTVRKVMAATGSNVSVIAALAVATMLAGVGLEVARRRETAVVDDRK
jgi:hypothetical protein